KFYVFAAAVEANLYALAVIGVVTSVVGAYYYLSIVRTMYFDDPAPGFVSMRPELRLVLGVTGLFVILFFVYPGPLATAGAAAAKSLFGSHGARAGRRRGGRRPDRLRDGRIDEFRGARPCARRRDGAAVDHGARPDRGPRPARPWLGLRARQPLRHPS